MNLRNNQSSMCRAARVWCGIAVLAAGLSIRFAASEPPAPPEELGLIVAEAAAHGASEVAFSEGSFESEAPRSLAPVSQIAHDARRANRAPLVDDPGEAELFDWEFQLRDDQTGRSHSLLRRGLVDSRRKAGLRR
jgi:hypothetical protein